MLPGRCPFAVATLVGENFNADGNERGSTVAVAFKSIEG